MRAAHDVDWLKRIAAFLCKTAYDRQTAVLKDLRATSNKARENNVLQDLEKAAAAVANMATDVGLRLAVVRGTTRCAFLAFGVDHVVIFKQADAVLREFGSKLPNSKQDGLKATLKRVRSDLSACGDDEAQLHSQVAKLRPSLQVLTYQDVRVPSAPTYS